MFIRWAGSSVLRLKPCALTSLAGSEGIVGRACDVSGVPKLVLVRKDGRVTLPASG